MQITTRPTSEGTGDLKIIAPISKRVMEMLDGRPKAFFVASMTHGDLKIYAESKFHKEW